MSERAVLWQFTASHFNEKARWALDWKGIAYERRSLLPGLHVPRVLYLSGQRAVPVLVLDGQTIADSSHIIEALERRYPTPPLYPADARERERARGLEEFFDEELGPHVRRALFHDILDDADYVCALFTQDAASLARRFYRAVFPAVRAVMKLDMRIDDARSAASRAKVVAALDRIEREVGVSGHLIGDRFTIADLSAAALFVPLVQPPEFPYAWPAPIPERAARWSAELATRPGFRWVQETYRRHRRPASPSQA
jgi:glutathione S-transferase